MAESTTTTTIPADQQARLDDLYNRTVAAGAPPVYQGPRVAAPTTQQVGGVQQLTGASRTAQQVLDPALAANTFWSDPNRVFDLNSVPGYAGVRQGIQNDVGRTLTENWLPAITGGSIVNSGMANNRLGLAQGEAIGRATEQLTSGLAGLDMNTAQMLLAPHTAAIARAPQMAAATTIPGDILLQAGGTQQSWDQANIEAERQKFAEEANAPYFALDQLRASLGLQPSGSVSKTDSDPGWIQTLGSLALLGKSLGGDEWLKDIWGAIRR